VRTPGFRLALGAALAVGAASVVPVQAARADTVTAPVTVTVNTRAGLATVPDTGIGVNDAVWDDQLGTGTVADLLKGAGVQLVRYPGGSYGDIYHWRDNTAPGGFVAPNTDFDTFMGSVRRAGAQPIIIANYGTGSAAEAADWVRYANLTKGYGARYWEIGNELYGNGHYGANWEADNHADKTPAGYANEVVAYSDAMKAVDPSVRVGAVLTMPANWPDGLTGSGDSATWNQTVLSIAGPKIDFVILHWYPAGVDPTAGGDPAQVLTRTAQLGDATRLIRQQLTRYAGPGAAGIGIAVTETSSGIGTDTQPGALFAADAYSTLLENGVFAVNWWDVHNGPGTVRTVAGQTDFGDWGLLSTGTCVAAGCEPAVNTPFAPYYGIQLMSRFARTGDQFVGAGTDEPLVAAHAARRPDGDLAVLLVNKDPDNARAVSIRYAGFTPAAAAPTVVSFTNGATALRSEQAGSATTQTLPPYSLSVLVLHPAGTAAAPAAPGQPVAGAVTDRTATLSWPAAPAGGGAPVAKYEVYRQVGAATQLWGETPDTTFTVANLEPGSRYTVNVLARDTAGGLSWASPPLTLTTGTPAVSTCSVRFADVSDWGSGFVGSVDVTNTGPNPVTGWTLTFGWPTGWQSLDSGWNGTWTQAGSLVRVTPADFNLTLAGAGGSTNIGFVGNYAGPNVLPTAFSLNGTVCSTG
jgi:Cellulose binding domain/Fibronectin type III domain